MEQRIEIEDLTKLAPTLHIGDNVLLSGHIYTARDAAHGRMASMLERGEALPITVDGQVIYYAGPCPAKPGRVIGSCGPTTSGRMDPYAPLLINRGLLGIIGKGEIAPTVRQSLLSRGGIYFAALGGTGALYAKSVERAEIIAFEDLGAEAIRRLYVRDFPAIVATDTHGGYIYAR